MKMYSLIFRLHGFLLRGREFRLGDTETVFDTKWFMVAALYILAFACMAWDPFFGSRLFSYTQGGFVLLIGFVIVTTLSFDWCYLGRSRGANLVLQFLLILPVSLLIGRLIGSPSNPPSHGFTVLNAVKGAISWTANVIGLLDLIPAPIKEVFASPGIVFLFFVICLVLTIPRRKQFRVGLLVTIVVFLFVFILAKAPSWYFLLGVLLMLVGVALQFRDTSVEIVGSNIRRRLCNVTDEAERRCSIRIMKSACANGSITLKPAMEIVRRCYVDQFNVPDDIVRTKVVASILQRLVYEHQMLSPYNDRGEWLLRPDGNLFVEDNPWSTVALVPRGAVLGLIAVCWWLLPVDLIPDYIPIVGSLDDFLVVTFSGGVAWRTLKSVGCRSVRDGNTK